MKKILVLLLSVAIMAPLVPFPATIQSTIAADGCFDTRKGNNFRDGVYQGTQINAPALLQTWYWQSIANISTPPVACGSRVYIASNDRKVHCIDRTTGEELWETTEMSNFPISSPTINVGTQNLYVATGGQIERQSVLYCLDAVTGTQRWQWTPGSEGSTAQITSGPTVVGENDGLVPGQMMVIVTVDKGAIFALDYKTGTRIWGFGFNGFPQSDPVIAEQKIFQLNTLGVLTILDLKTGKLISQTVIDDKEMYEFNNTPCYIPSYNLLICASRGKSVLGAKGKIYGINTTTGNVIWGKNMEIDQFHRAGPSVVNPPVVENTGILIGSDTGTVYMIDPPTGRMRWSNKLGMPITTDIIVSGKYALLGAANMLYAIDAAKGNVVFKQSLGNTITGHPIVNEGMVYCACNDARLYAFSDHDDFTIDALPRSEGIYPGNKRSFKVTISATMNFSHPLTLSAVGLPTTLKAQFSKPFVFPGIEPVEVDLTIDASPEAQPGNYICNVSGMLLGRERNAIIQIQVLPPLAGDFKLSVSSDQLSPDRNVNQGDSISFQVKVEAIGGFNAEVAFYPNQSTLPPGMQVYFIPDKITPDGYATAVIRTDTTTQADRYVIELQGHAGGKVRTTNVWFTVGGFDTEDWTQFQQNIFKTGANSKEKFLTDPEPRWDFSFKPEDNPEAVVRYRTQPINGMGKLFVVAEWESKDNSRIHRSSLICLDAVLGTKSWSFDFGKSVSEVDNFDDNEDKQWPVMCTPALDTENGYIYIGSLDGNFYCINAKTGQRVWGFNTTKPIRTSVLLLKQPEVPTKRVYFATVNGTVYCMAAHTDIDTIIWKQQLPASCYAPFSYAFNRVPQVNKGTILVPCMDGKVYELDAQDGTKYWASEFFKAQPINACPVDVDKGEFYFAGAQGATDDNYCYGSSMIYRNNISDGSMRWQLATFGPTFGSPALRINPDKDVVHVNANWGITPEIRTQTNRFVRVESENRQKILDNVIGEWSCEKRQYSYGSVIIDKDAQSMVYNKDGQIYCFDPNGKTVFTIKTNRPSKSHLTFSRRMLYYATEDGHVMAWAQKWGFGLAPETGSPVICQGTSMPLNIFFRSEIPLKTAVRFKIIQAPPDTTTTFSPDTLSASGTTTLSISVGEGCPEGTHIMVIQAYGAGFERSATISLVVRKPAPGDFTFTADKTKVTLYAGEPAEIGLTIDAAGGYVGAVSLSIDGLPKGVTGSFAPIITPVPGKSKYKLDIAKNTAPGLYNLTFRAEGGCKSHTFPVTLVVEPPVPGDYRSKLANPDDRDIVMWLGETKEVGIAVDFLEGYNLPVTFEVLGKNDFPGITFTFKPSEVVSSGVVSLVIQSEFLGQPIDGKRVTIVTNSGRKAPKMQVSFILTVKKEQGGFSISPKEGILQISAGQMAMAVFEVNMTSNFNASVLFSLNQREACKGIEYEFLPKRLAPSRLTQRVVCLIKVPPTFLDGDADAIQKGLKECLFQTVGIGGGQRVASRDVLLRVYKTDSPQMVKFTPEYKGLKKKASDTVDIEIGNLTNACAIEFDIIYDPLAIEIIDITEGPLMTTDLKRSAFVRTIDSNIGIAHVASTREQGAGPISGTGVFCRVQVKGTNITQETRVRIANIKVFDCNNGFISVRTMTGTEPTLKLTVSGFLPGDVNGDGKVDTQDLTLLGKTFGLSRGDPNFDARADFNEDGIVDGMDLIILCMNWGATLGNEGATP